MTDHDRITASLAEHLLDLFADVHSFHGNLRVKAAALRGSAPSAAQLDLEDCIERFGRCMAARSLQMERILGGDPAEQEG